MKRTLPATMRAATIDRFGGLELIKLRTLPVPALGPGEVLIRVESAGVAPWDIIEREGGFADMLPGEPKFPYVLGSDGAGTIAAVGDEVRRFKEGDRVYCYGFLNAKGGLYAEYAAVKAEHVSHVPEKITILQAGAMPCDAITAIRGLDDTLRLKTGETVMIVGASGGIGHMAVQFAKRMGARVLAVASGEDGAALAQRVGADVVADGRKDDVAAIARKFAPEGLDAALVTAGGEATDRALTAMRDGSLVAHPNGVMPAPVGRPGIHIRPYDGDGDAEVIQRLDQLIDAGPFEVHIGKTFPLERVADAHRALAEHHLGKLALRIH